MEDKIKEIHKLLEGADIYSLPVGGNVSLPVKDNVQTAYSFLQTSLLLDILNELKKLTKTEDVEVISEEISSVEDTKEVEVEKTKSTKKK
ncbi:MAG: hypothetical protein KA384_07940 [Leptotrichiaceae bacterium]|nr:hypothetical protein [Leptotrichiaceae bacterium]